MEDKDEKKHERGRDPKTGKFTVGNQFYKNCNMAGRDPLYETAEEVFEKIAEYLDYEDQNSKGKYTLAGCALWLGFSSRNSLSRMREKGTDDPIGYVVNRYYLFLEHYHEQKLMWVGSYQGSSFWLKNFAGYADKQEQTITQQITNVTPQIVGNLPPLANNHK